MAPTRVLITGATGYVGGTVLTHLLSSRNPSTKSLEISVLVRDDDRAKYFSSINLKVYIMQSLDDTEPIRAAASENDIVLHTAAGYNIPSAKALIEGLAKRKQQSPDAEVYFIQTSGTSSVSGRPISKKYHESRAFSDNDPDIYAYLKKREKAETYIQRETDIVVVETGLKENVPTTIIMSPTIYGLGTGKFNRLTTQSPIMMFSAWKAGRAEYVGDGKGTNAMVHVEDLAELYELVLLDWLEERKIVPTGDKGITFSGTDTFTWKETAEQIGKAGYELGKLQSAEPKSISLDEVAEKWTAGNEQHCETGFAAI